MADDEAAKRKRRTFAAEAEDRVYVVPAEDRTFVAPKQLQPPQPQQEGQ